MSRRTKTDLTPTEAVEQFIEFHEPKPWHRAILRELVNEAQWAEQGRATFWRLALELMEKIESQSAEVDEIASEIEQALKEAAPAT